MANDPYSLNHSSVISILIDDTGLLWAGTSGGGVVTGVPTQAISVGPVQTWQAEKISIWHAGTHDNPFGMRLSSLMISRGIVDSSVPMSLLADHPNVQFNYYRGGIGVCETEMH